MAEILVMVIITTTLPVHSTTTVAMGSLGNSKSLVDFRRPLKSCLDLLAEIVFLSQPLYKASCAMESSALANTVDTTPYSKGLNKWGERIIPFVFEEDVFIHLCDNDDIDPTQEWYIINYHVSSTKQAVKQEKVVAVSNPSLDLLNSAARVAPPVDARLVKFEQNYIEHQRLKAHRARKERKNALKLQKSKLVLRFVSQNQVELLAEIAAIVQKSIQLP